MTDQKCIERLEALAKDAPRKKIAAAIAAWYDKTNKRKPPRKKR